MKAGKGWQKRLGACLVIALFFFWVVYASCTVAGRSASSREAARSEIATAVTESLGCVSDGRAEFVHARLDDAARTSLARPTLDTFDAAETCATQASKLLERMMDSWMAPEHNAYRQAAREAIARSRCLCDAAWVGVSAVTDEPLGMSAFTCGDEIARTQIIDERDSYPNAPVEPYLTECREGFENSHDVLYETVRYLRGRDRSWPE